MNQTKAKIVCFWACVLFFPLLLFSCMGDKGNTVEMGTQAGVVESVVSPVILTQTGWRITSPSFSGMDLEEGDCCLVGYKIDWNEVNGSGPYEIELMRYDSVPQWNLQTVLQDTMNIMDGEQVLDLSMDECLYINGRLFLFIQRQHDPNARDIYSLSYNPETPAEEDSTGIRIYSLYLRTASLDTLSSSATRMTMPNAFNIESFVSESGGREQAAGNTALNFKIKFPTSLPHDTVGFRWDETDVWTLQLLNNE